MIFCIFMYGKKQEIYNGFTKKVHFIFEGPLLLNFFFEFLCQRKKLPSDGYCSRRISNYDTFECIIYIDNNITGRNFYFVEIEDNYLQFSLKNKICKRHFLTYFVFHIKKIYILMYYHYF